MSDYASADEHIPPSEVSVVVALTLDELSQRVAAELSAINVGMYGVLGHYLQCGRLLLEARDRCENAQWGRWLEGVGLQRHAASRMSRLAFYWDQIPDHEKLPSRTRAGALKEPSMIGLLKSVAHLPETIDRATVPKQHRREVRAEVLELRSSGASWSEIQILTGVPVGTAREWADPERAQRILDARKRKLREQAAARVAAKAERVRREKDELAARSRNTSMAACYATARKLAAQLDAACASLPPGDELQAARAAYKELVTCEGSIVRCLRLGRVDE